MKGPEPDRIRLGVRRTFWTTASVTTVLACTLLVLAPQVLAQNRTRDSERAIAILRDVFHFVRLNYVDADAAGTDKLLEGALTGMLDAVDDPYTKFFDRNEIDELNDMTTGEFGGVGLYLGRVDDGVLVIEPFVGSPAYGAGIMAGDLIVAIDGTEAGTLDENGVVSRLRGSPGTDVRVSLVRAGSETLEVTVTRELIEVPTVRHAVIKPGIGYLRVSPQFTSKTPDRIREALRDLGGRSRSLILDLRGNRGGLLSAVIEIADLFLDTGTIVQIRSRVESENQDYTATRRATVVDRDLPIVVLIDGVSASAAEILAGALKDHERAYLVGQQSYGKGSVQQVMRIEDDRAVKVTTSLYLTPDGTRIEGVGVLPHRITEPKLSTDEQETLGQFGRSKLLIRFALEHAEPTEAEIGQLLVDLEDSEFDLEEQTVRRQLARTIARIHRRLPIYDLVNDPSMIEAVRLLRAGEVSADSFPDDVEPEVPDSAAAESPLGGWSG
jgi:carboxyl-terminal processing protease